MAYDETKNEVLETWENEETGLVVSLNRYAGGEPKLQIGPRNYKRKDGTVSTTKTGRLNIADVLWLGEVLDEVKDKMNEYFLEEP
jgi:hypothetical protein